jgi:hypothetical protein
VLHDLSIWSYIEHRPAWEHGLSLGGAKEMPMMDREVFWET